MIKRPTFLWLLILTLLLVTAAPALQATAAEPLRLTQLLPFGDMTHIGNQEPGGTVDRGLTELRLYFNQQLDERASQGKVTVTDGRGETVPWGSHVSGGITLYPNWALHRGETYTIRVQGGPSGIKGEDGRTLPADLLIPLHVEQRPFVLTNIHAFGEPSAQLMDGGVIPRSATELRLTFTQYIGSGTVDGNVTVTDSQGQDAGWRANAGSGNIIYFYIPRDNGHLPKNETYTIRIKGGMGGVLSGAGVPLPKDLIITLRTDDQPYPDGRFLPGNTLNRDQAAKMLANFLGM